jgi:hypothetical protein
MFETFSLLVHDCLITRFVWFLRHLPSFLQTARPHCEPRGKWCFSGVGALQQSLYTVAVRHDLRILLHRHTKFVNTFAVSPQPLNFVCLAHVFYWLLASKGEAGMYSGRLLPVALVLYLKDLSDSRMFLRMFHPTNLCPMHWFRKISLPLHNLPLLMGNCSF